MSIEIVWTAISTTGLLVAVWAFLDANGAVDDVDGDLTPLQIVARGYRRSEAFHICMQLILLGIGVPSLIKPEPVSLSPFVAGLMTLNLLLVAKSVLNARDRLRVRKALHPPPKP